MLSKTKVFTGVTARFVTTLDACIEDMNIEGKGTKGKSLVMCQSKCLRMTECKSIDYNFGSMKCNLNKVNKENAGKAYHAKCSAAKRGPEAHHNSWVYSKIIIDKSLSNHITI